MLVQVGLKGKRLVAALTLEVFESRVGLHVSPEVGTISEALAAMCATVGLVAGVTSQVSLQKPRTGKGFAAYIALVVEVVSKDMHGQGGHANIHLIADWALLGVPRVEGSVCLPMSGQVAACGVVFTALTASVLWLHNLYNSRRRLFF